MSEEIFEQFKQEMFKKFNKKIQEGKSACPWHDADISILVERIVTEFNELIEAYRNNWGKKNQKELAEECIDLANQCLFLWAKIKEADE